MSKMLLKLHRVHVACVLPAIRHLSTANVKPSKVTKNLTFFPAVTSPIEQHKRPMALVFGWLAAKSRHLHKFGDFYLDKGFDVLSVEIDPLQLLFPQKAQREVIRDIVEFTHAHRDQPLLVHGFSVGAYLLGDSMNMIMKDELKYGHIMDRIVGQILDSTVDYTDMAEGFSKAVTNGRFPRTQRSMEKAIEGYLKFCYKPVTRHLIGASIAIKTNPRRWPCLMLYSDADPVSTSTFNQSVVDNWRKNGIRVYSKNFGDSPHVLHFYTYPVEYITQLNQFLTTINVTKAEDIENLSEVNRTLDDTREYRVRQAVRG